MARKLPLRLVGTHDGSFHCDEALGYFLIRLTTKFSAAEIVRTRDPKVTIIQLLCFYIKLDCFTIHNFLLSFSLSLFCFCFFQVLETFHALLDVRGVYDLSRDRYDHHQKGFEEVFGHGFTTKLPAMKLHQGR
ncbi:hypothetical protein CsSME_00023161 [Camellia sinensis var. sinensis]